MQVKWTLLVSMVMGLWVGAAAQATALQERAWKGDSIAMLDLSEAYTFGKGVTKNEDSAKVYRKKAAEKGLVEAQFLYGTDLVVDVFSTTNYAKGVAMLKKAADQGHKDAQYRLSEIHRSKGRGNESDKFYDLKKAYSYSELAAVQNVPEALMYCAESKLTGTGTTKSDSVACVYFQKAANEKKYVPAFIRMGDMYFEGRATGKVEPFLAVRRLIDFHLPILEQAALADFIAEGHFTRHLRRMRTLFAERRTALLDALATLPLDIHAFPVGSHCVGWLPAGMDGLRLAHQAAAHDLNLWLVSQYSIEPLAREGLVIGYGDHNSEEMQQAVAKLAKVMQIVWPRG